MISFLLIPPKSSLPHSPTAKSKPFFITRKSGRTDGCCSSIDFKPVIFRSLFMRNNVDLHVRPLLISIISIMQGAGINHAEDFSTCN